ncbi:MAG: CBS domain-containing protein [Phycisphaerales bacterium]|jgi:CBS domain-containing protein
MESGQFKLIDVIEEISTNKNIHLRPMRVASDIMNKNIKTLTLDHTVKQCLKFMKSHKVRHVTVVDLPYEEEREQGQHKPYFIGIVSERDMLRLNSRETDRKGRHKIDQRALRQLLVQIVARKPKSVSPQTPIQDVIMIMTCNNIDCVPVLNNGDLVGIITTTDIIRLFFKIDKAANRICSQLKNSELPFDMASENSIKTETLSSWTMRTVQDIMTRQTFSLEPEDTLQTAIDVMQSEEIRHILIINEQNEFLGLVSDRDILRNLPFAGKRPPYPPKKFREHLFRIKSRTKILQLPLEKIMQRKVLTIPPDYNVGDAVDILYKKKISCLPVIDEQGKIWGIITVTDLMRAVLGAYEPAEAVSLTAS